MIQHTLPALRALRRNYRHLTAAAVAALSLFATVGSASGADGDLDPTFDPGDGITLNTNVFTTAVQPDGKILIGGSFSEYRGAPRSSIARINPDGTVDTTFNPGAGADAQVTSLALQADGKIVIVGAFENYNGVPRHAVARLNSDGSLDAAFDPGAGPDYSASFIAPHAVVVQPDGKIVIGGGFLSYNGVARRGVARLNSNGSLDTSFDQPNGADGQVYALAVAPEGKIYVGGYFFESAGVERFYITRLNADGGLDTSFDPAREIEGDVRTLAVQGDGKVLVGGLAGLVRLNSNGSDDTSFKKDEYVFLYSCLVAADGKILIGGGFNRYYQTAVKNLARLAADGSVETTFNDGTGPDQGVYAMAFQPDGKLIIGGAFTEYNGTARGHVARVISSGGGNPSPTPAPTPSPTPSNTLPKGKLGTTYFGANPFGKVIRFTALITDAAASLKVRVQATTTPGNEGSWQDLPNGSAGRMIRDYSAQGLKVFVLNSTNYPLQNGIHFRAVTSAAGYPDSISEADGPFDLATNTPHAGPVELTSVTGAAPTNAPMTFSAKVSNDFAGSGISVRLQSSRTPGDESSWADFANAQAGTMEQAAPGQYQKSTAQYPTGESLYFRAVASRPGYVDSLSNIIGDYTLKRVAPPTVTITSPVSGPGAPGETILNPIVVVAGQTFDLAATASSEQKITVLRLLVDESTVQRVENVPSTSVQLRLGEIGHHRVRAIAITDGKVAAKSADVHIRVVRPAAAATKQLASGSKPGEGSQAEAATSQVENVWRTVRHGDWHDYRTWADAQGTPAPDNFIGPGLRDHAIVSHSVILAPDGGNRFCDAVTIDGGQLYGPMRLTVIETLTVGEQAVLDLPLTVEAGGELRLIGNSKVRWSGQLDNRGKLVVDGRGGIAGLPNSPSGSNFLLLQNQGQALFGGGGLIELAAASTNHGTLAPLKLLGNDGSSLLANDGATLLANDGASLIGQDGSSIVSAGAGNIVSAGAGNLLANDGASLAFRGGSGLAATRLRTGGNALAAEGDESFTMAGGVIDFGSSPRLASNLQIIGGMTISGGVVKGTGVIFGDVTQTGGFISPGNSAGAIGIDGNFTQSSDGTMIAEMGGPDPAQFDQLVVTGTANVNGKLNVRAINGYAPAPEGTFSPLAYSAGSGSLTTSSNVQMTLGPTGLLGTLNAAAPPPPPAKLLNIATRLRVEQGENALIGGFIITGSAPKRVIIRALGPSLEARGITGGVADPTLELFTPDGSTFNNNWRDSQEGDIQATTIPPSDDREAAIVATLNPGVAYTAIVRGVDDTTGVGLVEVYDLESAAASTLANISTRGLVQTGENVMIGGLIIGGDQPAKVLVRAIGPSLADQGVSGALDDPTLELNDANGNVISNDDWRATQEEEVLASTVPPTNEREAAIVATLTPGNYTAIVRGKGDTTGVALVEAYNLQ